MLAVIGLGVMALTLNWFDVATAFPLIGAEFHVGLGSLSLLISLYIVGYGLSHIPGGMLATRIGMKRTIVLGLAVQGMAGVMSGLSRSYPELALFRVVSGVGGSVFVAVGMAAWSSGSASTMSPWPSGSPGVRHSVPEQPLPSTCGSTCSERWGGTRRWSWPVYSNSWS